MIDPKMVELTSFNGIPHLIAPVVTSFEQVAGALAWVTREMDRRYKAFAASGARNIGGYNRKVKPAERLPFLVVIIDELADLMMLAADEIERYICRIAQMARATGIHMVIATQRPSTDVVTGLIKANFPARIAFAVSSQVDSRVILDTPGAERLLGRGDMLYMAPDSPKLARLQGCFVSDAEIKNVVQYWKRAGFDISSPATEEPKKTEPESLPWDDILKEANRDDLLEEAIKLVVESGRASTSFLQRKLGIGYPRASRLMDQLEEEGVVGPAEGNTIREVIWEDSPIEP
jgi:S-DNA-T family DNA segregation ATPase FtsK/SpoIIIE